MNSETEDLQTILTEMFALKDKLTLDNVTVWQEKYPQFSREIIEAYTDWRDFEFFVLEDETDSEINDFVSEKDKIFLDNLFRQTHNEAIIDLRELIENKGIERESFLSKLGFSETLMRKIERRNIEVPRKIQAKIGEILQVSLESLQAFFTLPAMLPKTARYKSKNAPQTQPKQLFAEAVYNDPELSLEEKKRLVESVKE